MNIFEVAQQMEQDESLCACRRGWRKNDFIRFVYHDIRFQDLRSPNAAGVHWTPIVEDLVATDWEVFQKPS